MDKGQANVMFSTNRQQSAGHLVEFKAGKSRLEPGSSVTKRKVVPEKTKGLIFIRQTDDRLMHFCWKNRETGNIVDDFIIFPNESEFKAVPGCPDGRVYLLKFNNSDRKCLYWLQDGNSEKDEENCVKVNDMLNNPPALGSRGATGPGRAGTVPVDQLLAGLGQAAAGGRVSDMDQGQQLMQLLNLMGQSGNLGTGGGAGGLLPQLGLNTNRAESTAANLSSSLASETPVIGSGEEDNNQRQNRPVAAPPQQPNAALQLSHLQNILSSITVPASSTAANVVAQQSAVQRAQQAIELESVLTGDELLDCVSDEMNEASLLPHLPQEPPIEQSRQELRHTIRAPQFRQATELFGQALQTGQMGPILQQFEGVSPEAVQAANLGDIEKFAEKLTEGVCVGEDKKKKDGADVEKSPDESSSDQPAEGKEPQAKRSKKKDDEEPDPMDLD